MQCTKEEIERKKREAQQKLAARNKNLLPPILTSNSNSPVKHVFNTNHSSSPKNFKFKPYEKTKTTSSFYNQKQPIRGTVYLISEDRFAVDLSEFSAPAVEIYKCIPSRSYSTYFLYQQ